MIDPTDETIVEEATATEFAEDAERAAGEPEAASLGADEETTVA